MDPSLYQQQREQQHRAAYPFPATEAAVPGGYPQPYNFSNNSAYMGAAANGINSMMPNLGNRTMFTATPVAAVSSMTANGMPPAKRVALAPPTTMQNIYPNLSQGSLQNQFYSTGGNNNDNNSNNNANQILRLARPPMPNHSSFMNPMSQGMDMKSQAAAAATMQANNPYASIDSVKYYGQYPQQAQKPVIGMNNLMNQSMHSIVPPDDNGVGWLDIDDTVYDFSGITGGGLDLSSASSSIGQGISGWNPSVLQDNFNYIARDSTKSYSSSINPSQQQQSEQTMTLSQSHQSDQNLQGNLNFIARTAKTYNPLDQNHQDSSSLSQSSDTNQQIKTANLLQQHQQQSLSQTSQNDIGAQSQQPQTQLEESQQQQQQLPQENNDYQYSSISSQPFSSSGMLSGQVSVSQKSVPRNSTGNIQHNYLDPTMQMLSGGTLSYSYSNSTNSSKNVSPNLRATTNSANITRQNSPRKSPQASETDTNSIHSTSSHPTNPLIPSQVQATPSTSSHPKPPTSFIRKQPQRPNKVTYYPKTRTVETYGGIDLRVFERFSIPLNLPGIQDLGAVDIHTLTMSLKSHMKLEVTNALNTLTTITSQRNITIDLRQCGDLLDVLLDTLLGYVDDCSSYTEETDENLGPERKFKTYQELVEISRQEYFELSYESSSVSEAWLSRREQCWCIANLIRNFSFMGENQYYLATHSRLITNGNQTSEKEMNHNKKSSLIHQKGGALDILDYRKSMLIILSNIASYLILPSVSISRDLLAMLADFLEHTEDYYAQVALEVLAKISVAYENRQLIGGCPESTILSVFNCLIRMLPRGDRIDPNRALQELANLESVVMALYNLACLSNETLRRRMANTAGFVHRMLKMSITLASISNDIFIILCRRAIETLKLLAKGNESVFLVYNEQLMHALLTPYIDPIVERDLESIMYPGDV
ncbi:12252_t:CDS:2 [Ambispora gerdemannii]|uniref:12252_t:CDS:1 n=1 Tax=Ambispora gerdemannii TaxID=144530 RepID=A0A9N9FL69_9GLOM|nr:12252_t:CDS:2 [Ambispora gerdemannii]